MRRQLAVLIAVLAITTGANAASQWTKAILTPTRGNTLPDDAVLNTLGAQRVHNYEAFTVARIPAAAVDAVTAAAQRAGYGLTLHPEWDTVHFPSGITLDTRNAVARTSASDQGLYVVQFAGPLVPEWNDILTAAGLQYISYLPHNAVLVFGTNAAIASLAPNAVVQWTSAYDPSFRAEPALEARPDEEHTFVVQLVDVPGSERTAITALVLNQGVDHQAHLGTLRDIWVTTRPSLLRPLLSDPYVVAIDDPGTKFRSGEREAIAATGSQVYSGEPYQDGSQPFKPSSDYRTWLSNRGLLDTHAYRIAIADSGLDHPTSLHPDLVRQATSPSSDAGDIQWHAYVGTNDDGSDSNGHGTMLAGIAVGDSTSPSTDADGFYLGMGLAPRTSLFIQKIFDANGFTTSSTQTLASDALTQGCAIQTYSTNDYFTTAGYYSTSAQAFDGAVRDTPMPISISAGNICGGSTNPSTGDCSTMVLSPATAKNVISVGGSESYRTGLSSCTETGLTRQSGDFSAPGFKNVAYVSRRATLDGRIKPEIIAPATMVSSTADSAAGSFCINANTDTSTGHRYWIDTGTSFASPQVAAAAVLLEKQRNATLSPAMIKAALVGGSLSVKGGTDRYAGGTVAGRPNAPQGFGRLSLGSLFGGGTQTYLDESSWTAFTAAGQTRSRSFTITDTSKPTIIVLSWTDEPASVGANPTLVRDLDMYINATGCYYWVGNLMDATSETSPAVNTGCAFNFSGADHKNNTEMIVLPAYASSYFTLTIQSTAWGFGSHDQKFAVYLSNAQ